MLYYKEKNLPLYDKYMYLKGYEPNEVLMSLREYMYNDLLEGEDIDEDE